MVNKIPQLNHEGLNQWRGAILGEQCKKFPEYFLFEQLFNERSPLVKEPMLSDRIKVLLKKYPKKDTYQGLKIIYPKALSYLKDNSYLDQKTYTKECEKCSDLIGLEKF